MIKVNVAEIKKRLVGQKTFTFDLTPDELEISPKEIEILEAVRTEGCISNAGDVLLLEATMSTQVRRTCGRCLKEFTAVTKAEVLEKFYPASADNIEKDAFVPSAIRKEALFNTSTYGYRIITNHFTSLNTIK